MKQFILFISLISSFCISSASWAGNKLFVGNLPFATTSVEVNRLVSGFGEVNALRIISIDNNGDMFTKAVVRFSTEESADAAAVALDGFIYLGQPLTASSKKAKEIIVVGSKVKEVIREAGLRSDGDLVQAVSDKVYENLEAAINRAVSNKRGTVRPYDL